MRRSLLYGLALVLAASLLVGAGSFDSISTERGVQVEVADDRNAYLGIADTDPVEAVEGGPSVAVMALFDNFPGDATLESAETPTDAPVTVESAGLSEDVTVRCKRPAEKAVPVTLVATGDGVRVDVTETVQVRCLPAIVRENVTFDSDCKNVSIDTAAERYPFEVRVESAASNTRTTTLESATDEAGVDSSTLVAVTVVETGVRFENDACSSTDSDGAQ